MEYFDLAEDFAKIPHILLLSFWEL